MLPVLVALTAFGATEAQIRTRLDEVQDLRNMRIIRTAPPIPDDAIAKIAAGDVFVDLQSVEGHASKKGYGAAVVDIPIARLWAAVNDDTSRVEYTKLSFAELQSGESCKSGRKIFQFLPLPIVSDRWWIADQRLNLGLARKSEGRVREMAWKGLFDLTLITTPAARAKVSEGIPLASTEGGWFLVDIDGQSTLLEYYAWSDPGGSLPKSIANGLAAGGIKDVIKAMETLANDGPACPIE